jgi:hypothetical protein
MFQCQHIHCFVFVVVSPSLSTCSVLGVVDH